MHRVEREGLVGNGSWLDSYVIQQLWSASEAISEVTRNAGHQFKGSLFVGAALPT